MTTSEINALKSIALSLGLAVFEHTDGSIGIPLNHGKQHITLVAGSAPWVTTFNGSHSESTHEWVDDTVKAALKVIVDGAPDA